MSNEITLAVQPRPDHGKGASGRLRRTGRVPAVVYGHEVEPTSVSVDALELYHALHTPAGRNALLRVEVDGTAHTTVVRDLQTHPVRGDYVHVDLLAVDRDQPIAVDVPIRLVDDDQAARDGGVINQILYALPISVRPADVPNAVEVSIAGMSIGDVLRVEEIIGLLPAGAEVTAELDQTVVTVVAPISDAELEPDLEDGDAAAPEAETDEAGEAEATNEAGADDGEAADGDA